MLQYDFMKNAIMVSALVGIMCPIIGIFLIQRRQAMIGDTLSHSALAGIAIGLMLNQNPILSSFIFSLLVVAIIEFLRLYFKKYSEVSLSVIMSLSIGIAITLISSGIVKANIDNFLFGSILTVSFPEVITVLILSVFSLALIIKNYDDIICWVFDEYNAKVMGIKVNFIRNIFDIVTCATIAISIKIVGTLVISSILIVPVATAMQFSLGFKKTLSIAIFVSLLDIFLSLFLSTYLNVAPGGLIALISVLVLIISIIIKTIAKI